MQLKGITTLLAVLFMLPLSIDAKKRTMVATALQTDATNTFY